ncbi:efflux RND transporter permease subunit [Marinimicrobium alkaliphilum]|uniref:efflux RND transporter permease subunit n=1 Tax=Marinimicrobium alkaliphilum TaxID=2202654 RepID=UPI0018E09D7A|nr:efflux RND transporter permease subunit [Marinimicrobium alkaliphilum]
MPSTPVNRLAKLLTHYHLVVLSAFVIIAIALGWQAQHFKIDASADTLLTQDNVHYIRTQVMNERFSPQEFILVAYEPKNTDLFSQQTYTNLESLTERLNNIERVESVRSLLNVPILSLMEGDWTGGNPEDWTHERQGFSNEQLAEAFSGNPIYEDLLVNQGQTATAIQILFQPHEELTEIQSEITALQKKSLDQDLNREEQERVEQLQEQAQSLQDELGNTRLEEIDQIRSIIADYEADADIYLGGAHVLGYQLIDIIQNDLYLFGGLIAGMICLVLFLLFGSFRWVLITVVCCGLSVFLTIALFGMLGLRATVISANFIALQLILTLAIVVHLIVQYREYSSSHPDWNQKQLIEAAFVKKFAPCLYAGLTTSVGFASLLFTGIQPVISFGWMMIIAVSISILVSLSVFPAMLALFSRESGREQRKLAFWTMRGFDTVARNRPSLTLWLCGGAFLLGVGGLFLLDVENSFIDYFSKDTDAHRELTFIDQELGGSTPLDVVLTIPEVEQPDLIITAEDVQRAQRVQEMLQEQEGMGKILSIVNFTQLAMELNDGRPLTEYELTAAYRMVDDELRDDLIGSYFSEEHSQLRISARIQDATEGLNRAELMESIKNEMAELGIAEDDYTLTNLFVLYQDILQRLFRSQILALGIVYIALTLAFFAIFRSVRLALVGITPNILSTVGILGVMGWLRVPLDLMTITIASIAMGIAVDDTIHYIHRYREELSKESANTALRNTNFSVGYAMLFTSVIIMLGFSQLAFSDFIPSVQFGLLASLAMFMALVWNLTLLPVLLAKFVPGSHKPDNQPA